MSDVTNKCVCGADLSKWRKRCDACREKAIIDAATIVEPDWPLVLVDSDTFFGDLSDAEEEYAGCWAHPCNKVPLGVNARHKAVGLAERVIEDMCEEAFEDAVEHVKNEDNLIAAFTVALEDFNRAQTACSWIPRTKEVFQIPSPLAATLTPDRVATPGLSQSTQAMPLPSEAEERATNSHQGE